MKEKIISLKLQGMSYREIEKITGINRGTISYYCNPTIPKSKARQKRLKRKNLKLKCIEYKGGKCCLCGFNRFSSALDFHHLDPSKKEINIAEAFARNHSFKRIQKELDKCLMVCSNCHRGIHNEDIKLQDNNHILITGAPTILSSL